MKMKTFNLKQNRTSKARAERITQRKTSDWYSIKNANQDRAEVFIFDEIGFFGVTAQSFIEEFKEIDAKEIDLRINSPGGAVFEGMAIFNAIKRHPANVTVHVDGIAASIAAVIAMAGDTINMAKNSHLMIHKAFTFSIGNADELRKDADVLDRIDTTIAEIFAERMDDHIDVAMDLMEGETWFLASEALELGLIDTIEGEEEAENKFDLSLFNHVPSELIVGQNKKAEERHDRKFTKTAIENVLRNAGYSRAESRAVVAKGFDQSGLRNADQNDKVTLSDYQDVLEQCKN